MPKRISITLLFTALITIVVVFAVTEVWAQLVQCDGTENTADYECNDGVQDNYTVRIGEQFAKIAPCPDNPEENCTTYRWNISQDELSHFNLVVEQLFLDKIVEPLELALDCDGSGDQSNGADFFGQFFTWHCFIKFNNTADPYVIMRGEFSSGPTEWFVKQSSTSAQGDFGITQGPAELCEEPETYVTTEDIKKVVQPYNGEEYAICLKAVKVNSKCYNEFWYACPPPSGNCNDLEDVHWCSSTQQPFDPRLVTQVYGEWSCSNVIYVPDDAAFNICGPDSAYPTCLDSASAQASNGGFANPCGSSCIECNFGGYPWCICW